MLEYILSWFFNPLSGCWSTGYYAMRTERNTALCSVLDNGQLDASHIPPSVLNGSDMDRGLSNEDEHLARLRAESDAQDKAQRLRVAQEQLAEYAEQKEQDASAVLRQAESLESIIQQLVLSNDGSNLTAAVADNLAKLKIKLSEAAAEAKSFATQQRDDVERAKRSHQQANLQQEAMDIEVKRARESPDIDPAVGEERMQQSQSAVNGVKGHVAGSAADVSDDDDDETVEAEAPSSSGSGPSFAERAQFIPMRLAQPERRLLRLLEAALNVSEYTDKVDILNWRSKNQRVITQIKDLCAILSGLVVAQNYKQGQDLIANKNFEDNKAFFQSVFEAGRRYKIMNPDKMRAEYGKLMYLLMDSSETNIVDMLGFKCVAPLKTVYNILDDAGALALLSDPLMETATAEIISGERPRHQVQRDIKLKEKARDTLAKRYRVAGRLTEEDILTCIYSISDNNTFLLFNRDPIDRMIKYFKAVYTAEGHPPGHSLAIQGGRNGARLTHNHTRQYHYVLQSLTLWREVSTDMFRLWYLAEKDMLSEGNSYRLCDTGQGLNRVQPAPSVSRAMQQVLRKCQQSIGHWVGSSVVHLGDHNVPNALMFIDKYTQVPRILNPVVLVLDELPRLARDPQLKKYIDETFGGVDECRLIILTDFCRHAFDGSGADNFFDAGSCIDGRLTSAWNWCSKLEKKPYFPVFKLAGFTSFDGDFQK